VVTTVGNQLRGEAGQQKLRQDVLREAFRGLEKVVAPGQNSSLVNRTRAAAFQRMGDIALELGDTEDALKHYQECQAVTEAAAANEPQNPVTMFNSAVVYEKLGSVSHQLENLSAARDYMRRSLDLRKQLATMTLDDPETPELTPERVKESLVGAYLREGDLNLMLGDPGAAWQSLSKHIELQEDRAFGSPREVFAAADALKKKYRVGFWLKMGQLSFNLGDETTCRSFYDKALKLSEGAVARDGKNAQFQQALAASLSAIGDLELMLRNAAKALEHYRAAHAIYETLAASNPDANTQRVYSLSFYRLGTACLAVGETAESEKHYQESLKLRRELSDTDPRNAYKLIDLIVALARCGQHAEATDLAGKLRERAPQDPSVLFYVACGYALSIPAVTMNRPDGSSTDGESDRRQRYAAAALDSIRQAIANGYKDHVALEHDPDLTPVREHADFVAEVAKLKSR
jgi:tetratricopeptide (TPR) repeat protein